MVWPTRASPGRIAITWGVKGMIIARTWILGVLIASALSAQSTSIPDSWEPVRFLVGSWEGDVSGQPGNGTCERKYGFVLNNRYLEVRNKSTYPVQAKNPKGEVHEDWGMISYDRGRKKLILRQFHVEGFVNQFASEPAANGPLRFTSESIENIPTGYRARETYSVTGPDTFVEQFELAEPGKDFELYSETRFRRKK
jgi:hypothetical protein